MFTNLIESASHRNEFKRRSSFFLATTVTYALILFAAGVASIYTYDAHLEAQNTDILISWLPAVKPVVERDRPRPFHRAPSSNNPGRVSPQSVRPVFYESASNPRTPPSTVSVMAQPIPPAPPNAKLGRETSDPLSLPGGSSACVTCTGNGTAPVLRVEETTPPPALVAAKPPTHRLPSHVLTSKAISLPKPAYPPIARQIRRQGPVAVQILVDENGKVVSAHSVSGDPTLTHAAVEAAYRARFTPTMLSGQAVKVQGVITYNFVLQ